MTVAQTALSITKEGSYDIQTLIQTEGIDGTATSSSGTLYRSTGLQQQVSKYVAFEVSYRARNI
jgi:hypothetical protein